VFVKIGLFNTFTRTVRTCGCETGKIYTYEKKRLSELFRKKHLEKNNCSVRENGMWVIKCDGEYYREFKDRALI